MTTTSADATRHEVDAALRVVFDWTYDSELCQIRDLYVRALDRQWVAHKQLDLSAPPDPERLSSTITLGGIPIYATQFWQNLPAQTRAEIARRNTAFMLSNFLHGEQGALLIASQLVNLVPDGSAKLYAATQTLDEARHLDVFSSYLRNLDAIHPAAPALHTLLERVVKADTWLHKMVGMQIVIEGLALVTFQDMRNVTQEPLLKQILAYVVQDEARHAAYGVRYLGEMVPALSPALRRELEDFAYEATCLLIDTRSGNSMRDSLLELWKSVGIDPAFMVSELGKEADTIKSTLAAAGTPRGPLTGFILPTLKSLSLFSDRMHGRYEDLLRNTRSPMTMYYTQGTISDWLTELPSDLERWAASPA